MPKKPFAAKLAARLRQDDIRPVIDERSVKMQKKIRDAELEKAPYMAVVGEKEVRADSVAVRSKKDGDLGMMKIDEFIKKLKDEIKNKGGG